MLNILLVLIGGGLGSVARFILSNTVYAYFGKAFPYGILACNVIGCFVIGLLAAIFIYKFPSTETFKTFCITGFLGGFTTFSSFSLDTLELIQSHLYLRAFSYVMLSIIISMIFVALGFKLGFTTVEKF